MIVLICGGRNYENRYAFDEAMKLITFKITAILHGGARGADLMADGWAKRNGIQPIRMDALWGTFDKGAGTMRNKAMLELINPKYCIAFPGGTGTADMVRRCKERNIPVWVPYANT